MSALAGIRYFDDRPVSEDTLDALARFNRLRGPHSLRRYTSPGIALVACGLHFDALSTREHQPVETASGLVVTFDGRLDNRDDLALRYRDVLGAQPPDGTIVARHIEAEGTDGLVGLIGDFSVAFWDSTTRSVTLARDFIGNRPLYYVLTASYLAWSTCLETLVRLENANGRLDDDYMAGALTFGAAPELTPFAGIRQVPGNTALTVTAPGRTITRVIWDVGPTSLRYRQPEMYSDHLRALLDDAVQSRLRCSKPAWADLSGGLDSSTVVALAQRLVNAGRVEAPQLRTFSRVFPGSPESDERRFIEAVRAWTGCQGVEVEDCVDFGDLLNRTTFCPFRLDPAYGYLLELLAQTGSCVWLTGGLGDLIMGKTAQHSLGLLDYFYRGEMRSFVKRSYEFAHFMNDTLWHVWLDLLRAHEPPLHAAQRFERDMRRKVGIDDPWSDRAVAEGFGLADSFVRRCQPRPMLFADGLERWPVPKRHLVQGIRYSRTMGGQCASDSLYGVRFTSPYLHRPLVEFVLSIPTSVVWEPGRPRALMRTALQGALPPAVIERQDKGYAPPAMVRMLRPFAMDMLRRPTWYVVEAGYVDRARYERQIKAIVDGRGLPASDRVLMLEAWLRSQHEGIDRGAAREAALAS
jgi:asparagine synthase (glutamine-hydrolysing)